MKRGLPLEIYPLPFSSFDSLIIPFLGFNGDIIQVFFFFLFFSHRAIEDRRLETVLSSHQLDVPRLIETVTN